MTNKVKLASAAFVASALNASAAMTADPSTGLTSIEGYADTAIAVAIGIGVVVIGWSYVKRLVKKG
jgi:hypothetical protein